jgi:hypothetical protein
VSERDRLREAEAGSAPWRRWGPYVALRAWGTVREDYSADGAPQTGWTALVAEMLRG